MNKNTADSNGNYADYLADTAESNKDSFTDDEFKTLTDDIETIRKIEEQIAEIEKKLQNPIKMGRILILKMHHHSKISQVRISMVILLTKVFFRKCSNCHQFLVYRLQALCC